MKQRIEEIILVGTAQRAKKITISTKDMVIHQILSSCNYIRKQCKQIVPA